MDITLDYVHHVSPTETATLSYSAKKILGVWILTQAPGKKRFKAWLDLSAFSAWSFRDAQTQLTTPLRDYTQEAKAE